MVSQRTSGRTAVQAPSRVAAPPDGNEHQDIDQQQEGNIDSGHIPGQPHHHQNGGHSDGVGRDLGEQDHVRKNAVGEIRLSNEAGIGMQESCPFVKNSADIHPGNQAHENVDGIAESAGIVSREPDAQDRRKDKDVDGDAQERLETHPDKTRSASGRLLLNLEKGKEDRRLEPREDLAGERGQMQSDDTGAHFFGSCRFF